MSIIRLSQLTGNLRRFRTCLNLHEAAQFDAKQAIFVNGEK
jgi:hypothetical protein